MNDRRTASVKAETYCNVYSLSVQHFDCVLRHYPAMRRTMAAVADQRLNQLGLSSLPLPHTGTTTVGADMYTNLMHFPSAHSLLEHAAIQHLDWFNRFCRAH